jgi:hypothetical protein
LRRVDDRGSGFHAEFHGSGASSDSFVRANRYCRFQHHFGHDCGTKACEPKSESRTGSDDVTNHHGAEHAVTGKHRGSNAANCCSYAADGLTDAVDGVSKCEHDGDGQSLRDAEYNRHGFRFDYCHSWISASSEFQHSGNYHGSAGKHNAGNDGSGNGEPLSDYADCESSDS